MKTTLTVEIAADEFMALAEKWAEINGTIPANRYRPPKPNTSNTWSSTDSWVGKKVKVKPEIPEYEIPHPITKDKEYFVSEENARHVRFQGVHLIYIEKDKLILV